MNKQDHKRDEPEGLMDLEFPLVGFSVSVETIHGHRHLNPLMAVVLLLHLNVGWYSRDRLHHPPILSA